MDLLQRFVIESLSPAINLLGNVTSGRRTWSSHYLWLRNVREENQALKEQLAAVEQKVTDYREAYVENMRLRRLLDFKATIQWIR